MNKSQIIYVCILLASAFVGAISQIMLKKAAMRVYPSLIKQYLNPLVIFAYTLFGGTTLLTVIAYRGVPLSLGPVLESSSYVYVALGGIFFFKEKLNARKVLAMLLILSGIFVYSVFG